MFISCGELIRFSYDYQGGRNKTLHTTAIMYIPAAMKNRVFDLVFASAALVVAAIPMAFLYAATKVNMGSPVIFRQKRIGMDGELFDIYKFRSMKNEFNSAGNPLPDSERVTSFGKFMRLRGLDELPQFFNVINGDMSIIGARPRAHPPINTDDLVVTRYPEILNARPGLVSSRKVEEISRKETLPFSESDALDVRDANKDWSIIESFNLIVKILPVISGRNQHERSRIVEVEELDCDQ